MLLLQAKAFRSHDEDEDDDSDDDFSDDEEELQSPLDEVDPFIFFVETIKGMMLLILFSKLVFCLVLSSGLTYFFPCIIGFLDPALQASDPLRFQSLTQTLDFHYQALANGVAQHAEQRKVEIEKEKMEKASAAAAAAAAS